MDIEKIERQKTKLEKRLETAIKKRKQANEEIKNLKADLEALENKAKVNLAEKILKQNEVVSLLKNRNIIQEKELDFLKEK